MGWRGASAAGHQAFAAFEHRFTVACDKGRHATGGNAAAQQQLAPRGVFWMIGFFRFVLLVHGEILFVLKPQARQDATSEHARGNIPAPK